MKTNKKARKHRSSVLGEIINEITPQERAQTEFRMTLAARLDDLIKAKGWSKSEFASKMGKQPSEITKWLSGTHNFTTDTLLDIALLLNIHIAELFTPEPRQVVQITRIEVSSYIPKLTGIYRPQIFYYGCEDFNRIDEMNKLMSKRQSESFV